MIDCPNCSDGTVEVDDIMVACPQCVQQRTWSKRLSQALRDYEPVIINEANEYIKAMDKLGLLVEAQEKAKPAPEMLRFQWVEEINHLPYGASPLQLSDEDDDDTDEHEQSVLDEAELYIKSLAQAMGLGGWTFKVDEEVSTDGTLAEIECVYGQRHAVVFLAKDWATMSPTDKRDTLVHELLHAHLSGLMYLVNDLLKVAGKKAAAYGGAAWHLHEEYTVEALAQAWAPMLPEPKEDR